jgi:hypothetical protein
VKRSDTVVGITFLAHGDGTKSSERGVVGFEDDPVELVETFSLGVNQFI